MLLLSLVLLHWEVKKWGLKKWKPNLIMIFFINFIKINNFIYNQPRLYFTHVELMATNCPEDESEDESNYVAQDLLLMVDSIEKWKELTCIEYPGKYIV